MKVFARILVALLLVCCSTAGASAAEEIRDFHARIDVGEDGTLTVTETITVNAEGLQISRGIFRDIPLRYEDENGRTREVRLDVRSVTRDGESGPYATERGSGVLRVNDRGIGTLVFRAKGTPV